VILRAFQHPDRHITWLGGGSPPIALGGNRFLMIYHNGRILADGWREYNACAAILNFDRWNPDRPDNLVEARLEDFFVPETPYETNESTRIRIVFPVGSYAFGEDIHVVYGAGDVHSCAARVNRNALVQSVEESGLGNKHHERIPQF
jgi:beta-1,2-mannobiose phosphorylase / 1,2-beta-oligomannan phosphorylase